MNNEIRELEEQLRIFRRVAINSLFRGYIDIAVENVRKCEIIKKQLSELESKRVEENLKNSIIILKQKA